jgi:hypothetical protein
MRLKRIAKFAASVTKGLLPTQQATLRRWSAACSAAARSSLPRSRGFEIKVAFPHNLKRVERYIYNPRLHSLQSKQVVARRLLRQLHHRLQLKPQQAFEIIRVGA